MLIKALDEPLAIVLSITVEELYSLKYNIGPQLSANPMVIVDDLTHHDILKIVLKTEDDKIKLLRYILNLRREGNEFVIHPGTSSSPDPDCICHGNWRHIIKDVEPFLDKEFKDRRGDICIFAGVVHGKDDYYYLMIRKTTDEAPSSVRLLSCVGSITDGHGYSLIQ